MYPYHPWSDLVPEDADSPDLAGYMGLFGIDDPYCCLESSSLARQTGRLLSRLIRVCPSHPTASPALCLALHQYDSSRDEYARYCREPIYINPAAVSLPDLPIDVYVAVQQWMHHVSHPRAHEEQRRQESAPLACSVTRRGSTPACHRLSPDALTLVSLALLSSACHFCSRV